MSNSKKRVGRPPKGSDQTKSTRLDLRVDEAEKEAFRIAAEVAGLEMSGWIRERLRSAARKELVAVGQGVPFLRPAGESK